MTEPQRAKRHPRLAYPLTEWRLFCNECGGACDVKAVDVRDAVREAFQKGWTVIDGAIYDPVCLKLQRNRASLVGEDHDPADQG